MFENMKTWEGKDEYKTTKTEVSKWICKWQGWYISTSKPRG